MVCLRVLKFFAVCFGLRLTFAQYAHAGQRELSFGVIPRTLYAKQRAKKFLMHAPAKP